MTALAICLIVVGGIASAFGALRLAASRRRVLAPGEVPPGNGVPILIAGDISLIAGVLLLVL
ncbi:hypothetical protein [Aeromicrobium sp.]|uniref:hypothetical protein n=1 Tax=Aeromicrobium sp. TaxID=1871063 RepID=UPI002FCBAC22